MSHTTRPYDASTSVSLEFDASCCVFLYSTPPSSVASTSSVVSQLGSLLAGQITWETSGPVKRHIQCLHRFDRGMLIQCPSPTFATACRSTWHGEVLPALPDNGPVLALPAMHHPRLIFTGLPASVRVQAAAGYSMPMPYSRLS